MNKLRALSFILLSFSLCPDPTLADENSQEVLRWAYGFDKVGELALRQSAEGDYVSQFGTILDVSCFKGMNGDQRKKLESQFEEDLIKLLQKTRACHENYPEVGYLSEVVSVLRRSVIVCKNEKHDPKDWITSNLAYAEQFHYYDTPNRQGRTLFRSSHYKRLYYIVIPTNLSYWLLSFPENRVSLLFHETLHFTGANNRFDHAGIQWKLFNESNPCQTNILDDRVVFITDACGFNEEYGHDQIRQRIQACGIERGCMASLMNTDLYSDFENAQGYDGRPWKQQEARRFCQKLEVNLYQNQRPDTARFINKRILPLYEMVLKDWSDLGRSTNFPARYLAALTPEERSFLVSYPNFERDLANCKDGGFGAFDPEKQPPECPLSFDHPLFPITGKLAEFSKLEAELRNSFWEIAHAMPDLTLTERPKTDLNKLKKETEKLFETYCPQKPNAGEFYPQLCFNGKTALLENLRLLEQFFSNRRSARRRTLTLPSP